MAMCAQVAHAGCGSRTDNHHSIDMSRGRCCRGGHTDGNRALQQEASFAADPRLLVCVENVRSAGAQCNDVAQTAEAMMACDQRLHGWLRVSAAVCGRECGGRLQAPDGTAMDQDSNEMNLEHQ